VLTLVEFRVAAKFGARYAAVAGDFTAWAPMTMERSAAGEFRLGLQIETGRRLCYRFLLDGETWMNDPNAPELVTMPNGAAVSALCT
jgi:1,4-alpha-glucan branching enzyme